jgi:hypothetical protein
MLYSGKLLKMLRVTTGRVFTAMMQLFTRIKTANQCLVNYTMDSPARVPAISLVGDISCPDPASCVGVFSDLERNHQGKFCHAPILSDGS